jgi:hypothetical protein
MSTSSSITRLAVVAVLALACGDDTGTGGAGASGGSDTGGASTGGAASGGAATGGAGGDTAGAPGTGGTPAGGAPGTGGSGGAAMGAAFGEPCTMDADCESNLCGSFMMGNEMLCTIPCTEDSDCPPPQMMCNNMGICRP